MAAWSLEIYIRTTQERWPRMDGADLADALARLQESR